uniref:mitogen-activated protein kinase n=1 Tax=Timema bartmani TaxID=61472 RepID=A0A7R9I110_9NEOP|nr:unnamed protein product [Timema bartmani]
MPPPPPSTNPGCEEECVNTDRLTSGVHSNTRKNQMDSKEKKKDVSKLLQRIFGEEWMINETLVWYTNIRVADVHEEGDQEENEFNTTCECLEYDKTQLIHPIMSRQAYGIVWKAIDKRTKEVVAVKKIFDAFRNQTDAQRTFREIMFLREFGNHPNVVKLHNIYKASNNKDIYLIFEYMDTDLHNVIKRGNILKDIHKRFIMYQLLKATKYIHSGNVIHRDQKPSNILIDAECRCKVADFGLARSVTMMANSSGESSDPALTDYVATRWYRAPEILIASKRYTKGIDMWSLGCILAEMLLGKPLFPGSSTINQIERIMSTIPPPTTEDVESICVGYGSSLLQRAPAGPRRPLTELLKDSAPDAIDLVTKLLVFHPHKRLTASEALVHPYVQRFHNSSNEPSLSHDVLPPLRDDVQLAVDDYRNKLYEMMSSGLFRVEKQSRILRDSGCRSKLPQPCTPSWAPKVPRDKERKCRHLSVEELRERQGYQLPQGPSSDMAIQHGQKRPPALNSRLHPPLTQHRGGDMVRPSNRGAIIQRVPPNTHQPSRAKDAQHHTTQVHEGPKLGCRNFRPHPHPLLATMAQKPNLSLRQQKQYPAMQQRRVSMPFNSFSQNHGIITASALLELRPTLRW